MVAVTTAAQIDDTFGTGTMSDFNGIVVGGKMQETISVVHSGGISTVTAKIVDLDSGLGELPVEIYFAIGLGKGPGALGSPVLIDINPKPVDVSRLVPTGTGAYDILKISSAGSRIWANVQGVGVDDVNRIVLIDENNGDTPLCETLRIPQYGLVECETEWQSVFLAAMPIGVVFSPTGRHIGIEVLSSPLSS